MKAPGAYYPGVSALRGFAALLVVVQHAGYLAAKTAEVNYFDVVKIDLGLFGIVIFFTISGFVIGLNRHLPTGEFIVRRALRIYPAYWVAYATSALILLLVGKSTGFSWAAVFLLPSRTYPNVDLPIWTLVFEVFFYALAAAMFSLRLSDRALAGFALCWIIAIAHMQPYVTQPAQPGALIPVAQYNIFFALGLLCALKLDWLSRFTVSQLLGVAVVATAVLPLLPAASQVTKFAGARCRPFVDARRGNAWRSVAAQPCCARRCVLWTFPAPLSPAWSSRQAGSRRTNSALGRSGQSSCWSAWSSACPMASLSLPSTVSRGSRCCGVCSGWNAPSRCCSADKAMMPSRRRHSPFR